MLRIYMFIVHGPLLKYTLLCDCRTVSNIFINKQRSESSMEVKLPAVIGNYDRRTIQRTDDATDGQAGS